MNQAVETSKLVTLRLKTDRQLALFIQKRLDAGMEFAQQEDPESHFQAQQIYAEARELRPLLGSLGRSECRRIDAQLEQLGNLLGNTGKGNVLAMCG